MTGVQSEFSFFDHYFEGDVVIVSATKDQLTDEENLEQMGQELAILSAAKTPCKMVCDLNRVRYVSSSAIGKLIALHRGLIRSEGQVVLCCLQPAVKEILETSNLLTYFQVSNDVPMAISKLQ